VDQLGLTESLFWIFASCALYVFVINPFLIEWILNNKIKKGKITQKDKEKFKKSWGLK
tara:strand:- start:314 stop:487 length:174 start_codon:yes stop_codon:yes gene_type:complete